MQTHIGVDLHQRFCYLTAVDASGKTLKQSQVVNEGAALRAWLRQLPGPRQVVEASGLWPSFVRAVEPESERIVMAHPRRVKAIASSLILCATREISGAHPQMERPGIVPPLCAQGTNRSLYAIYSQTSLDIHASFHRRMTRFIEG